MSGETFTDLLAPNLPAIRRLVKARIRMPDYADDVLQQTLMHAFAHRNQLRTESKFKSWIVSIAMNEIRGLARRHRASIPLEAVPRLASAERSSCPHRAYEQSERAEWLQAGLAKLTDRDRNAIQLLDLAELKLTDVARKLSVSSAALKSTQFRARRRLGAAILAHRNCPSYPGA